MAGLTDIVDRPLLFPRPTAAWPAWEGA